MLSLKNVPEVLNRDLYINNPFKTNSLFKYMGPQLSISGYHVTMIA